MEPPTKLRRLNSPKDSAILDRLSDLPDELTYYIFSLQTANKMIRMSFLSRRFRQLCILSPYWSFSCCGVTDLCTQRCKNFICFLNKIWSLRDGKEIHTFRLSWCCRSKYSKHDEEVFIHEWVANALKSKVQVLDLNVQFNGVENFVLCPKIFSSPSIRVLNLASISPKLSTKKSSPLQVLSLSSLKIVNGGCFNRWVYSRCKSLKKLKLDQVSGVRKLSITSSSLENLSIDGVALRNLSSLTVRAENLRSLQMDTYLCRHRYTKRNIPINISAGNLQDFNWTGRPIGKFSGNFLALETANIKLCKNFLGDKGNSNKLLGILQNINLARTLRVSMPVMECLSQEKYLPVFKNLVHLHVDVSSLMYWQTLPIFYFLSRMPLLTTLTIKCNPNSSNNCPNFLFRFLWKGWGSGLMEQYEDPQKIQNLMQLKEVYIHARGTKIELGLPTYLLKIAKGLKEIKVYDSTIARDGLELSCDYSFKGASSRR